MSEKKLSGRCRSFAIRTQTTPVERAIQMSDIALLDIKGTLVRGEDDEEADKAEGEDEKAQGAATAIEPSTSALRLPRMPPTLCGLPQKVVGMAAGDESSFEISFGEEDVPEALRGKTLHQLGARGSRIQRAQLDDELQKNRRLRRLRNCVRTSAGAGAGRPPQPPQQYHNRIFDELSGGNSACGVPEVMLEERIDHMITTSKASFASRADLKSTGSCEGYRPTDTRRHAREPSGSKQTLALRIAEAEELSVKEAGTTPGSGR